MTELPDHIAEYLEDAGFTATEILILRHMLLNEVVSLRELASRTSKSTGVLDKATRKLLQKGIMQRQLVNGVTKYTLKSFEAVSAWVEEDLRGKHELLQRRQSDFLTFVRSIRNCSTRPMMEHFEGEQGMQKAYESLIGRTKEILHFLPSTAVANANQIEEFYKPTQRLRKTKGISDKIIAPDNSFGRKIQERDAYETRETRLIPPMQMDLQFEKIISGQAVACFDHEEQQACLIEFPQLANAEQSVFDTMWRMGKVKRVVEEMLDKPIEELYRANGDMKSSDVIHIATIAIHKERQDWIERMDGLELEKHRTLILSLLGINITGAFTALLWTVYISPLSHILPLMGLVFVTSMCAVTALFVRIHKSLSFMRKKVKKSSDSLL